MARIAEDDDYEDLEAQVYEGSQLLSHPSRQQRKTWLDLEAGKRNTRFYFIILLDGVLSLSLYHGTVSPVEERNSPAYFSRDAASITFKQPSTLS
jgi:hypothetical protein